MEQSALLGTMFTRFADSAGPAEQAVFALSVLVLAWCGVRWCRSRAARWLSRTGLDAGRSRLIVRAVGALAAIVALQLVFGVLNMPALVVSIGGGLALLGLGLAGSLSPMLADIAAGLLLRSDGDLRPGAQVRIRGVRGEVVSLELRKLKIKSATGEVHVFPCRLVDQDVFVMGHAAVAPGVAQGRDPGRARSPKPRS
ncbi:MAG TPA: mechanosensitive ion channel domain-containing protein [Limnochordia bacterium]|nr:mechanosensitive ion channel domain-containing protein [Limnochordia bacterium]